MQADGSYPDLVGFDGTGAQRVLIEVKFWADLTNRQPNRYLDNLPDDGPAVLMFLVPEERVKWIWPQLRHRIEGEGGDLTDLDAERKCARVGHTQRYLMVASWGGLLDSMAARSRDNDESGVDAEIRQLRSLAKYADTGAIKPIIRGEEFGGDSEERQRQYKRLVDDATERGVQQEWASRKGLNRTPRGYGYGRYIRLQGHVVWFGVNRSRFEKTGDTPLWVDFYSPQNIPMAARNALDVQDDSLGTGQPEKRRGVPCAYWTRVVDSLKHIADILHEAHEARSARQFE